jgi:hypothetical protein
VELLMLEENDVTEASEVDSVECFLMNEGVLWLDLDFLFASLMLLLAFFLVEDTEGTFGRFFSVLLFVFGFSPIAELFLFGCEEEVTEELGR